jgi:aminoglycoside phosphotransferase family enzyme/predicted kinase
MRREWKNAMNDLPAQQQLIAALLDPQRQLLGARSVRLIETHISWVLIAGSFAYKIKKAVNLGFLDFTSLAKRRFYCEEELRLNRRLAPQLYLEAVPIGGSAESPILGQEPAIEYAVKMRRFAPNNLMDKLLAKGKVTAQHIDQLAAALAAFHHSLPRALPDPPYGSPASIRAAAVQNFEQMQPLLADLADLAQLATIKRLTEDEYAAHEKDFAARRTQGFVRECHGDLHLGNIALIRGQPVPFDGIEFSTDLRWEDVMSEAAFPVMDLLQHRQPQLAHRLLNDWLEVSGDYEGLPILRFYIAYRAMVRAKIAAIRAAQPGISKAARGKHLAACRSYMLLAEQTLRAHSTTRGHPALIITHGLPGSGKTTFAQAALEKYGAIRIRSDVERKRLFGLGPLEESRTGENIYSLEATQRTYARLLALVRIALAAGYPVIVDAAFLKQSERQQFHALANEMGAPYAIASLHAPDATLQARVAKRHEEAKDASEADVAVLKMLQTVQELLAAEEQSYSAEFPEGAKDEGAQGWGRLEELLADK